MNKRFLVSYATFATPTKPQVMDSTFVDVKFDDNQTLVSIQQLMSFVYEIHKITKLESNQFAIMGFCEIDPDGFEISK